jgi:uncharacterized membrane protein
MGKAKTKSNTKKQINENKRIDKKKLVLGENKKSRTPIILASVVLILLIGGGVYWVQQGNNDGSLSVATATASAQKAKEVVYPATLFADGKARHFKYSDSEHTIRYFILQSADGIIRAAFDACDVCWPSNKGYYQEGDNMVCRNCGRKFASVKVNVVQGGCNPAPLKRAMKGDKLVLQVEDILAGKKYFDFKNRG